jgi:hypothetical protein
VADIGRLAAKGLNRQIWHNHILIFFHFYRAGSEPFHFRHMVIFAPTWNFLPSGLSEVLLAPKKSKWCLIWIGRRTTTTRLEKHPYFKGCEQYSSRYSQK